jgi:uncharacterized damage-inducible protein DinB
MTRDELARLVAAHDAVWDGWWPLVRALSPALADRAIASSHPSVSATAAHMIVAEAFWQHRLDGGPVQAVPTGEASLVDLEHAWRSIQRRRLEWLGAADPHGDVAFTLSTGYSGQVKTWECICHVASHAHFHRGQLVTLLRQLGVTPPSFDLLGSFSGAF